MNVKLKNNWHSLTSKRGYIHLYLLHSKTVLPTMVCVLVSTILRKCINKIGCNLQGEIIFSTSVHGVTIIKKLVKHCSHT